MSTTPDLRLLLEAEQKKTARMRELATTNGFFTAYYKMVPDFKTNKACFEAINAEYEALFLEPRYSDYQSFRQVQAYETRKRKLNQ